VTNAVEVSPARPEEYAVLGDIVVNAYRSVGVEVSGGYAVHVADVAARAAAPGVAVLAARIDEGVIGSATVVLDGGEYAEGDFGPDAAVLRMVGVDSRWRGHGAGRALVTQAIDISRRHGRRTMGLYSQPVMHAAHTLYESLGFVRRPERDAQPEPDVQLLAYELRL
jgi:GNAT superfamily N-acetyltransferase